MKNLLIPAFLLLLPCSASWAQKYTVSGFIKDAASGESLIGANVFDKNTQSGNSSNTYGFYSLTLPADSVTLIYSYVGYAPQKFTFYLDKDTTLNVELISNAVLDEIVVKANEGEAIQEITQMSSISVPISQIKSLPSFMGEVDVLKVLQLLPGVQSGSEGSSGMYVRGGGPDQNLILMDGVPVYNASHLFGFFSVFNPDAINNVELIKGGFPARYGGRLSSVIDISMKEGNMKEFKGEGSIGLISSKLTLEGPISKDKTSFIVSGRRTYIDLLARPLIKASTDGDETVGYYFYDLNAKINHKFSDKDRLYLSAYLGDDKGYSFYRDDYDYQFDRTKYEEEVGLRWGNITSALRWNHVYNPKLFSNLTLTYSRYRFNTKAEETSETIESNGDKNFYYYQWLYHSGINDLAAKIDYDFIPSSNHYIRFGASATYHTFSPGALNVKENVFVDTTLGAQKTYALEFASYIEDDFEVNRMLKINAGLHFSGFKVNGKLYTSLQPRLSTRLLLADDLSLKASYVKMTQYIHLLTNSGIGLPTDLWVPATDKIKPQQAHQLALGLAKTFKKTYEISLEGYYKTMDNLIAYKEGSSFVGIGTDWQNKVERGKGQSYGAELFIQKKEGKTTGWIGYTLSWTHREFDNLNFGKRFPYKYDRRHDLSVALVHHWKDHIDVSMSWVYGTGNAVTLPKASYQGSTHSYGSYYGDEIYYYGDRNSFRMNDFHRLDLSIAFRKKKKWGERTWTFGVYNTYNRKNPFYLDIGYDDHGNRKFVQYSLFPIMPSVSYSFKF